MKKVSFYRYLGITLSLAVLTMLNTGCAHTENRLNALDNKISTLQSDQNKMQEQVNSLKTASYEDLLYLEEAVKVLIKKFGKLELKEPEMGKGNFLIERDKTSQSQYKSKGGLMSHTDDANKTDEFQKDNITKTQTEQMKQKTKHPTPLSSNEKTLYTVKVYQANARVLPDINSRIEAVYEKGRRFYVTELKNNWLYDPNRKVWIHESTVKKTQED